MTISKLEESTVRRLPPNAGKGRRAGTPNKMTASAKEMIMGALGDLGGQAWLVEQAKAEPKAFLALVARLIPTEAAISADITNNSPIVEIRRTVVDPRREVENDEQ